MALYTLTKPMFIGQTYCPVGTTVSDAPMAGVVSLPPGGVHLYCMKAQDAAGRAVPEASAEALGPVGSWQRAKWGGGV